MNRKKQQFQFILFLIILLFLPFLIIRNLIMSIIVFICLTIIIYHNSFLLVNTRFTIFYLYFYKCIFINLSILDFNIIQYNHIFFNSFESNSTTSFLDILQTPLKIIKEIGYDSTVQPNQNYIHFNNLENSLNRSNKEMKPVIKEILQLMGYISQLFDSEFITAHRLNEWIGNLVQMNDCCHSEEDVYFETKFEALADKYSKKIEKVASETNTSSINTSLLPKNFFCFEKSIFYDWSSNYNSFREKPTQINIFIPSNGEILNNFNQLPTTFGKELFTQINQVNYKKFIQTCQNISNSNTNVEQNNILLNEYNNSKLIYMKQEKYLIKFFTRSMPYCNASYLVNSESYADFVLHDSDRVSVSSSGGSEITDQCASECSISVSSNDDQGEDSNLEL